MPGKERRVNIETAMRRDVENILRQQQTESSDYNHLRTQAR
jgi:hypothetical protein